MKHILMTTLPVLFLISSTAWASTTWYVNGVSGSDSNTCASPTTACKTIKHAISRAAAGDSIIVAAATYTENLTIGKNLTILGSGATTTIIDGRSVATVVTISSTTAVKLSGVTIRNGSATQGGGIYNSGTLTLNDSNVSANHASVSGGSTLGGGIYNAAVLTINKSTISGNTAAVPCPSHFFGCSAAGGGIYNSNVGTLTISSSTLLGNSAGAGCDPAPCGAARADGGAISNAGKMIVSNSTLVDNTAWGRSYLFPIGEGGGISNGGAQTISNTTVSGNRAVRGGGISGAATIQNSIVANNSGGNCSGTMTSEGYTLSSDGSCSLSGPGDMQNTDPLLGPLQNNGGPTQTMALLPGSPAIDAGNPSGCTNSNGVLLKIDQRGMPRPDKEDAGGCDMGAYERQSD